MTYSFVVDREVAGHIFPKVGKHEIVLAILASITPLPGWNGCLVYEGPTPLEEMKTFCIGTRGPGADEVQERLIEGFEKLGVPIIQVYEGGPELRGAIAKVSGERWIAA